MECCWMTGMVWNLPFLVFELKNINDSFSDLAPVRPKKIGKHPVRRFSIVQLFRIDESAAAATAAATRPSVRPLRSISPIESVLLSVRRSLNFHACIPLSCSRNLNHSPDRFNTFADRGFCLSVRNDRSLARSIDRLESLWKGRGSLCFAGAA